MSDLLLPESLRGVALEEISLDDLIAVLEGNTEGKISVNFQARGSPANWLVVSVPASLSRFPSSAPVAPKRSLETC